MTSVVYKYLDPQLLKDLRQHFPGWVFSAASQNGSRLPYTSAGVLLLGAGNSEAIAEAQLAHTDDSLLSVVILTNNQNDATTRRLIQFTPYIGKYTACYLYNDEVYEKIDNDLQKTNQRRNFAKFNLQSPVIKPAIIQIDHLGDFLEQAPIATILANRKGMILDINPFAKSMFCLPQSGRANVTLTDLFPAAETHMLLDAIDKSPGHHKALEIKALDKFIDITFTEVQSKSGESLVMMLLNDVSESRLAEQKIRTILDSLPQMGWITDDKGCVIYLTEGWYQYTGQPRNESADNWPSYIMSEDRELASEKSAAGFATGKMFEMAIRYKKFTGEYRWHLVKTVPVANLDNKVNTWLGIATDIEAQKQIELGLEKIVDTKTVDLKESNALLTQSNSDLAEFAHVASHDLQEPLRKIRIYSDFLLKKAGDPAAVQLYSEKIDKAAGRMSNLIKGILNYSSLEKKPTLEALDLNQLLETVTQDYELLIADKKAVITSEPLPRITGIRLQMEQLFSNLINNSLKYGKGDGVQIHVGCKTTAAANMPITSLELKYKNYYELSFCDNGIGFNQSDAEKIFKIFSRLHERSAYSGTGIGLSVCKKVVNNHEGFIMAKSNESEGAVFYVYLPVFQE